MGISKSKYVAGCQCPKILWMSKNMPEEFDESVKNVAVMATGDEVGDLAMGYFGDYVEIPFDSGDFKGMAAMTQELLEKETPVICEATFMKNGLLCMVDILRVEPGSAASEHPAVHIIEVKSSTEIKDYHLTDVSFQLWLLEECGLDVKSVSLMYMNKEYVRNGELDVQELFVVEDVTEKARELALGVPQTARMLEIIRDDPNEPGISIGNHCDDPFTCGYKGWCWRHVPKPSVHDIARIGRKAWDLHESGIVSFEDVVEAYEAGTITLNAKQARQVTTYVREDDDDIIDVEGVREFLDTLSYPLYYLDFETIMPAVPMYDGMHPYQQLTTQYSLHWEDASDGPLQHAEFLAEADGDPRRAVAERLCEDIPADVCVVAYNTAFEKGRIEELADCFPDLHDHLMAIHDNMVDLIVPFRKGHYYNKAMGKSYSIKYVLPALFPNDPELDYSSLEGVHHGGEAMEAFAALADASPEEAAALRESLLRYCELDTYAMVKIVHKLYEVV